MQDPKVRLKIHGWKHSYWCLVLLILLFYKSSKKLQEAASNIFIELTPLTLLKWHTLTASRALLLYSNGSRNPNLYSTSLPTSRLCRLLSSWAFAQVGDSSAGLCLLLCALTPQPVLQISSRGWCPAVLLRGWRGTVFGGGQASTTPSAHPLPLLQFLLQALIGFASPFISVRKCSASVWGVSIWGYWKIETCKE